ncbi:bifunctional metallophosphatase/5'-nucleotidase [Marinomonas sp. C2222]|uniref:Bifunctional metallophosphatase/5'-nucleotidase n=1 Tax=Marinomonas sargassi TaxID=2984494 RepID=A0ABT2YU74_9GAMM|nr:bifunctional metallophosphatase/5'-nucleotidase [Marinomonas sargassi]MCV2403413.1 bifunctional metallophosphatase/5'-nucleotidase [Marinomonas sargassi]
MFIKTKILERKNTPYQAQNFLIALCILVILFLSAPAISKVTIVYTSNQPNILLDKEVAHFPQLSTLLNTLRSEESENTLFLQGGDNFSPSAISMFDDASNIIALANMMEASLYSVGKRELTYDVDVLSLRALEAQFPIISSNLLDSRSGSTLEGLFRMYDFNVDDINISVASLVNKRVLVAYTPEYAQLTDINHTLEEIQRNQANADIKILMTDLEESPSIDIARKYDFDLILVAIDGKDKVIQIDDTLVAFGGGQDGDTIVITYEQTNKPTLSASIEDLSLYEPDPQIVSFVEKYRSRISSLYQTKIAVANSPFTTKREIIRTQETPLANTFADAIREYTKAQIAVLNSGAIRNSADYPKGYNFTRGDIQSELPFGNHTVVVKLSGNTIKAMMENALSRIEHVDGRFLNVSGMKVTYDSSAPPGSRVRSISVANQPLNDSQQYEVAIPSFYAQGGDDYSMLKNLEVAKKSFSKKRNWLVIAQYLEEKQTLTAEPLGRMVDISRK